MNDIRRFHQTVPIRCTKLDTPELDAIRERGGNRMGQRPTPRQDHAMARACKEESHMAPDEAAATEDQMSLAHQKTPGIWATT